MPDGRVETVPKPDPDGTSGCEGARAAVAGPPGASHAFLASLLVLTFFMNTIGRGVTETFAVFLLPVESGLGATRSEMTAAYSLFALAYGCSAPFTGQLIDRLGARVTYGFGRLCTISPDFG